MPEDHPVRFVAEFVDALERSGWSELGVEIDGEALGAPSYHPRGLLSVWLYGFMTGVRFVPQAGGGLPRPDTVPLAQLGSTRTTIPCGGSTETIVEQ